MFRRHARLRRTASDLSLRRKADETAVVLAANREGYEAALDHCGMGYRWLRWWICGWAANLRLPGSGRHSRCPRVDGVLHR
jgi:hypothetical protein